MDGEKKYGHERMVVYQNIDRLDGLVQKEILSKIPRYCLKLREQIDSASDSVGANFVEGYYSGSLAEYLRFLRYARRSLGELQERVRRCVRKGFVSEVLYAKFRDLLNQTIYLFVRLMEALEAKGIKSGKG